MVSRGRGQAGWQSSACPTQTDGLRVQLPPSSRPLPSNRHGTGLPTRPRAPAGAAGTYSTEVTSVHSHSGATVLRRSSAVAEPGAKWEI